MIVHGYQQRGTEQVTCTGGSCEQAKAGLDCFHKKFYREGDWRDTPLSAGAGAQAAVCLPGRRTFAVRTGEGGDNFILVNYRGGNDPQWKCSAMGDRACANDTCTHVRDAKIHYAVTADETELGQANELEMDDIHSEVQVQPSAPANIIQPACYPADPAHVDNMIAGQLFDNQYSAVWNTMLKPPLPPTDTCSCIAGGGYRYSTLTSPTTNACAQPPSHTYTHTLQWR